MPLARVLGLPIQRRRSAGFVRHPALRRWLDLPLASRSPKVLWHRQDDLGAIVELPAVGTSILGSPAAENRAARARSACVRPRVPPAESGTVVKSGAHGDRKS